VVAGFPRGAPPIAPLVGDGIAAADFSRVRNADLDRFTVDRLVSIINRLGSRVELKVKVRRAESVAQGAPA
jgi:predicted XRE-type DNA-binding protein